MRHDAQPINWYTRASWDCVHFESPSAVQQIRAALVDTEFRSYEIDGSAIGSTRQMVTAIAGVMEFPANVSNWDGVHEYLWSVAFDFSSDETQIIGRAPGVMLVVTNGDEGLRRDPYSAGDLISVWLAVAEDMSTEGVAAHLVFEIRPNVNCG